MYAGTAEHVRRDTDLAPGGVADALSLAVLRRRRDEGRFEFGEIERLLGDRAAGLQSLSLLEQVEPLQRDPRVASFSSMSFSCSSILLAFGRRPRRGLFDSSASRYLRTASPSARPAASAALCSFVIDVLFFVSAMP